MPGDGNIRTVVSPRQIKSAVAAGGMQVIKETMLQTNEGLKNAFWEVDYSLRGREKVVKRLAEDAVGEKSVAAIVAMQDALQVAADVLENKLQGVTCMDVFVATFEAAK